MTCFHYDILFMKKYFIFCLVVVASLLQSRVAAATHYVLLNSGYLRVFPDSCLQQWESQDDKLVFKLNMYEDFNDMWDAYGFSVTFDTGNNTYIQWKGSDVRKNSSLISVEVNNQPINNSLTERKITVDDLDTEGCEDWEQIVEKNPDLICADDDDFIRRMTDNAKLMASEDGGNSWYEVLWNDSWEPDFTYKFEVVDETGD